MKKLISLLLCAVMIVGAFSACGKKQSSELADDPSASAAADTEAAKTSADEVDIDLTKMSGTMIYSEVLNMLQTPDNYLGKTVKMTGNFTTTENQDKTKRYFACIIPDATACCSQGIEFVLDGSYEYPLDYPELNSEITVSGVFDVYYEGDYQYCQLLHAVLL